MNQEHKHQSILKNKPASNTARFSQLINTDMKAKESIMSIKRESVVSKNQTLLSIHESLEQQQMYNDSIMEDNSFANSSNDNQNMLSIRTSNPLIEKYYNDLQKFTALASIETPSKNNISPIASHMHGNYPTNQKQRNSDKDKENEKQKEKDRGSYFSNNSSHKHSLRMNSSINAPNVVSTSKHSKYINLNNISNSSLTPLPYFNKKIKPPEVIKENFNKAERTAVHIRRLEYAENQTMVRLSKEEKKIKKIVQIQRWWRIRMPILKHIRLIQALVRGHLARNKFYKHLEYIDSMMNVLAIFNKVIMRKFKRDILFYIKCRAERKFKDRVLSTSSYYLTRIILIQMNYRIFRKRIRQTKRCKAVLKLEKFVCKATKQRAGIIFSSRLLQYLIVFRAKQKDKERRKTLNSMFQLFSILILRVFFFRSIATMKEYGTKRIQEKIRRATLSNISIGYNLLKFIIKRSVSSKVFSQLKESSITYRGKNFKILLYSWLAKQWNLKILRWRIMSKILNQISIANRNLLKSKFKRLRLMFNKKLCISNLINILTKKPFMALIDSIGFRLKVMKLNRVICKSDKNKDKHKLKAYLKRWDRSLLGETTLKKAFAKKCFVYYSKMKQQLIKSYFAQFKRNTQKAYESLERASALGNRFFTRHAIKCIKVHAQKKKGTSLLFLQISKCYYKFLLDIVLRFKDRLAKKAIHRVSFQLNEKVHRESIRSRIYSIRASYNEKKLMKIRRDNTFSDTVTKIIPKAAKRNIFYSLKLLYQLSKLKSAIKRKTLAKGSIFRIYKQVTSLKRVAKIIFFKKWKQKLRLKKLLIGITKIYNRQTLLNCFLVLYKSLSKTGMYNQISKKRVLMDSLFNLLKLKNQLVLSAFKYFWIRLKRNHYLSKIVDSNQKRYKLHKFNLFFKKFNKKNKLIGLINLIENKDISYCFKFWKRNNFRSKGQLYKNFFRVFNLNLRKVAYRVFYSSFIERSSMNCFTQLIGKFVIKSFFKKWMAIPQTIMGRYKEGGIQLKNHLIKKRNKILLHVSKYFILKLLLTLKAYRFFFYKMKLYFSGRQSGNQNNETATARPRNILSEIESRICKASQVTNLFSKYKQNLLKNFVRKLFCRWRAVALFEMKVIHMIKKRKFSCWYFLMQKERIYMLIEKVKSKAKSLARIVSCKSRKEDILIKKCFEKLKYVFKRRTSISAFHSKLIELNSKISLNHSYVMSCFFNRLKLTSSNRLNKAVTLIQSVFRSLLVKSKLKKSSCYERVKRFITRKRNFCLITSLKDLSRNFKKVFPFKFKCDLEINIILISLRNAALTQVIRNAYKSKDLQNYFQKWKCYTTKVSIELEAQLIRMNLLDKRIRIVNEISNKILNHVLKSWRIRGKKLNVILKSKMIMKNVKLYLVSKRIKQQLRDFSNNYFKMNFVTELKSVLAQYASIKKATNENDNHTDINSNINQTDQKCDISKPYEYNLEITTKNFLSNDSICKTSPFTFNANENLNGYNNSDVTTTANFMPMYITGLSKLCKKIKREAVKNIIKILQNFGNTKHDQTKTEDVVDLDEYQQMRSDNGKYSADQFIFKHKEEQQSISTFSNLEVEKIHQLTFKKIVESKQTKNIDIPSKKARSQSFNSEETPSQRLEILKRQLAKERNSSDASEIKQYKRKQSSIESNKKKEKLDTIKEDEEEDIKKILTNPSKFIQNLTSSIMSNFKDQIVKQFKEIAARYEKFKNMQYLIRLTLYELKISESKSMIFLINIWRLQTLMRKTSKELGNKIKVGLNSNTPGLSDHILGDDDSLVSEIIKKTEIFSDPKIQQRTATMRISSILSSPKKLHKVINSIKDKVIALKLDYEKKGAEPDFI